MRTGIRYAWKVVMVLALCTGACCCLPWQAYAQVQPPETEAARKSLQSAIDLLSKGTPFEKVLPQWEAALPFYSSGYDHDVISSIVMTLRRQVTEERNHRRSDVPDPVKLPLQERIAYYIARFPEVKGFQFGEPGMCRTTGNGADTKYSDAVVKIGRAAVPLLLKHLNDNRVTRSMGWRNGSFWVLRVQDVALECIEAILGIEFFHQQGSVDYFSRDPAQRRTKITAEIQAWWDRNAAKPPVQGLVYRLNTLIRNKVWIGYRVTVLSRIEALDKHAVNAVGLLKSWLPEARQDQDNLVMLARELTLRGDGSQIPVMRKLFIERKGDVGSECLWCLLQFGNRADYVRIQERIQQQLKERKEGEDGSPVLSRIVGMAEGNPFAVVLRADNPRIAPLLVPALSLRRVTGAMGGPKGNVSLTLADEAMRALVYRTRHSEGYDPEQPEAIRFKVMDRWRVWWIKQGRALYHKQHPNESGQGKG